MSGFDPREAVVDGVSRRESTAFEPDPAQERGSFNDRFNALGDGIALDCGECALAVGLDRPEALPGDGAGGPGGLPAEDGLRTRLDCGLGLDPGRDRVGNP
ncbi:hypothetical protein GCM10008995_28950 [Halobellus salinus]|uniref:Uncharacterized protein n=1 Tax=Halobellus salinus TaxID=931585 RepID=A0A830ERN8_9EURY|nr:hypothetical protein GCM10008995_28950 [Halobellus salinus]